MSISVIRSFPESYQFLSCRYLPLSLCCRSWLSPRVIYDQSLHWAHVQQDRRRWIIAAQSVIHSFVRGERECRRRRPRHDGHRRISNACGTQIEIQKKKERERVNMININQNRQNQIKSTANFVSVTRGPVSTFDILEIREFASLIHCTLSSACSLFLASVATVKGPNYHVHRGRIYLIYLKKLTPLLNDCWRTDPGHQSTTGAGNGRRCSRRRRRRWHCNVTLYGQWTRCQNNKLSMDNIHGHIMAEPPQLKVLILLVFAVTEDHKSPQAGSH